MADTKNTPYGNKSSRKILKIVRENSLFLIKKYKIKMLVIACNTATSVCADRLRKEINIPIVCVEPPIKPALEKGYNKILILGTKRTLKSNKTIKKYIKIAKVKNRKLKVNKVTIQKFVMPSLASDIDKNIQNLTALQEDLNFKLKKFNDFDCVVIGCTHYNFIKEQIKKALPNSEIISCEINVAYRVKTVLERRDILSRSHKKHKVQIILTKNNQNLKNFLKIYLF